jgi:hypothetical protein
MLERRKESKPNKKNKKINYLNKILGFFHAAGCRSLAAAMRGASPASSAPEPPSQRAPPSAPPSDGPTTLYWSGSSLGSRKKVRSGPSSAQPRISREEREQLYNGVSTSTASDLFSFALVQCLCLQCHTKNQRKRFDKKHQKTYTRGPSPSL